MFNRENPYLILAAFGRKIYIKNSHYYNYTTLADGVLLPYYNQHMLTQNQLWHDEKNPPFYYNNYLTEKIIEIRNQLSNSQTISFAFLTDAHLKVNAWRSPALIKFINDNTNAAPFTIFGGDLPMATSTED